MRRLAAVANHEPGERDHPPPTNPRSGRRLRLPDGKYALVASAVVAALVIITSLRADDPMAAPEAVVAREPITAPATKSEVVDTVVVRADYAVGNLSVVPAPVLEGSEPIVTHLGVAPGDRIEDGAVIAVVAGRAMIAAQGPFPMYRTILPNDVGEDVEVVQQLLVRTGFLRAEPDGRFGKTTQSAFKAFMADRGAGVVSGFSRDGRARGPIIRKGELVFLPQLPARVASVDARVGDRVGEGLVRVEAAPPELGFEAVPDLAALLAVGQTVLLSDTQAGLEAETIVVSIERQDPRTYRVLLQVPDELTTADVGRNLKAIVRLHESDAVLNVPLAAIQTHADGSASVQVVADAVVSERPVTVGRVAVGRAVIEHGLTEGERVVVGWYQP